MPKRTYQLEAGVVCFVLVHVCTARVCMACPRALSVHAQSRVPTEAWEAGSGPEVFTCC